MKLRENPTFTITITITMAFTFRRLGQIIEEYALCQICVGDPVRRISIYLHQPFGG
jgi:hypothetical protein